MFTIEEVKSARTTTQFNIPAGAKREYGEDSIKRAIEEQARAEDASAVKNLRSVFSTVWQRLTGSIVPVSGRRQSAR